MGSRTTRYFKRFARGLANRDVDRDAGCERQRRGCVAQDVKGAGGDALGPARYAVEGTATNNAAVHFVGGAARG